ncbi:MAG: hypothetical protein IPI46_10740 [Bacteroidetes bacterium]|nr:hypothetical protein [Bacteroidota bacterium]
MKHIPLLLSIFLFATSAFAQKAEPNSTNLAWIQIMQQDGGNYFEALKSFEAFWDNKQKPVQEDELFSASTSEKESPDFVKNKQADPNSDAAKYAFEYKKFKYWQAKVLPFVQADGRILTKQEQLDIWQQSRQSRK